MNNNVIKWISRLQFTPAKTHLNGSISASAVLDGCVPESKLFGRKQKI